MPLVAGLLGGGDGFGGQPGAEDGVGHVGLGPVVYVHLLSELGGRRVEEEGWVGGAGDAPDYFGSHTIVPAGYFVDDADCFVWFG